MNVAAFSVSDNEGLTVADYPIFGFAAIGDTRTSVGTNRAGGLCMEA
jgi:hypothetical protein